MMMLRNSAVLFLLAVVQVTTSESVVSPVQNLEPSLAASAAHSSTVAVESKDGVVLIYRSPKRSTSNLMVATSGGKSFEHISGLRLCANPPKSSSRWNLLAPNNCFCTMTGFSADITHLQKVLARTVESHQVLFHQSLSLHKCMQSMSSIMQRATQRGGGRPFGIQALLVGMDKGRWQVYSCDPTGLYRHFPKGRAAIGKYADSIVKECWKEEEDEISTMETDAKQALELCLHAIVQASRQEHVKLDLEDSSLEGLFLWQSSTKADGECLVAQIDPAFLEEYYQEAIRIQ